MMWLRSLAGLSLLLLTVGTAPAKEPEKSSDDKVSFHRDVRPIFQAACIGCHQAAKLQGGYLMTTRAGLLGKGDSGVVSVVPGKPEVSHLMVQITSQMGKPPAMPKGLPTLTEKEVQTIKQWIKDGAVDDTPQLVQPVIDATHPPVYEAPPVVTSVEFSPDGKTLAVAGYHEVLLYSADGANLLTRLVGQAERVQSLAFSPDGKKLAVCGGSPGRFGEVQVWEVESRKLEMSRSITFDTLYGVSWSPDATKLAFGCGDNTLRAIDPDTGKQVLFQGAHNDWVLDTVFSADGSHLVSVSRDRSMKLTHVPEQRFVDNITSITPGALKGGLQAVARHPKKDELVVGGADGTPRIYQMHRTKKRVIGDDFNKLREFSPMKGRIFAITYSSDGNFFAAATSNEGQGEVYVYNANDPAKAMVKCEGQKGAVYAVSFSPDGKVIASSGFDGAVRLNDTTTGKLIKEFVSVPLKKK